MRPPSPNAAAGPHPAAGAYDDPAKAACAHDVMALRAKTAATELNFPAATYRELAPLLHALAQARPALRPGGTRAGPKL